MDDGYAFVGCKLFTEKLTEMNHSVKIVRNVVIRPVFEVEMSYCAFIFILKELIKKSFNLMENWMK